MSSIVVYRVDPPYISENIPHTYVEADEGIQEITVSCSNPVSGPFNRSFTIDVANAGEVIPPSGLTVDVIDSVATGDQVTFSVGLMSGNYICLSVSFGDDEMTVTPECGNTFETTVISHAYLESNNYTAVIQVNNEGGALETTRSITVLNPVPNLMVNVTTDDTVLCPPGELPMRVSKVNSSDEDPTDPNIVWEILDATSDPSNFNSLPYNEELIIPCTRTGEIIVQATVRNAVSEQRVTTNVTLEAPLGAMEVDVSDTTVAVDTEVIFNVSFVSGSNMQIIINYNDTSDQEEHLLSNPEDASQTTTLRHVFEEPGNFSVLITALNHGDVEVSRTTIDMMVQRTITTLNISVSPDDQVFNGADLTYLIVLPSGFVSPTNVHIEWDFGDNSPNEYSYGGSLEDVILKRHVVNYSNLGLINTSVRCWNLVSSIDFSEDIIVREEDTEIMSPNNFLVNSPYVYANSDAAVEISYVHTMPTTMPCSIELSVDNGVSWTASSSVEEFPFTYNVPTITGDDNVFSGIFMLTDIESTEVYLPFNIELVEELGSLDIGLPEPSPVARNNNFPCDVRLTNGSHVRIDIVFGDGSANHLIASTNVILNLCFYPSITA